MAPGALRCSRIRKDRLQPIQIVQISRLFMASRYASWIVLSCALAYLLGAIALAALLAYPIDQAFELKLSLARLVNRLALLLLVIGILPASKLARLSWAEIGFPARSATFWRQFALGFLIGIAILSLVIVTLVAMDVRSIVSGEFDRIDRILKHFGGALASAMGASLVEETLFRGVLFGALIKYANLRSALTITAFFYAALHFLGGRGDIEIAELSWTSGLELLPDAWFRAFNSANLDSFVALLVVSVFLCAVRIENPRGIAYCMGLHTAWVFLIKLTKRYTAIEPDSPWNFLVGTYDGVIGILVATWLGWITLVYLFLIHKRSLRNSPASE